MWLPAVLSRLGVVMVAAAGAAGFGGPVVAAPGRGIVRFGVAADADGAAMLGRALATGRSPVRAAVL